MKTIMLSAFLCLAGAAGAVPTCRTLHPDPDALRARCERLAYADVVNEAGPKVAFAVAKETQLDVVDILVGYDLSARAWLKANGKGTPEEFAAAAVVTMNDCLGNTGLSDLFRFRLAGVVMVDVDASVKTMDRTLMEDLVSYSGKICHDSGEWAKVSAKREALGADIVSFWVDGGDEGLIGIGYSLEDLWMPYSKSSALIPGFGDWAYNVCSIQCVEGDYTALHEIGHNMGCGHPDMWQVNAYEVDPGPQLYPYSSAFYFDVGGQPMGTIMAYDFDGFGGVYEPAPVFSSASHAYGGAAVGDANHDNTRTLRETFKYVAQYRVSKLAPLPPGNDVVFGVVWPGADGVVTNAVASGAAAFTTGCALAIWQKGSHSDGRILYTTDGSDPAVHGRELPADGLVPLPGGSLTVKAVAVCDGKVGEVGECALTALLPTEGGWLAADETLKVAAGQLVVVEYSLVGEGRAFRVTLDGETLFSDASPASTGDTSVRKAEFVVEKGGSLVFEFMPGADGRVDGVSIVGVSARDGSTLWPSDGAFSATAARIYDGFLMDGDGVVRGIVQVKAGKASRNLVSKIAATVQKLGGKKLSFKGETSDGKAIELSEKGGEKMKLTLGAKGMFGSMGALRVEGSLTDAKSSALALWKGVSRVFALKTETAKGDGSELAWGYSGLSVVVGAKGKAKVSGVLADGTKVSAPAQLLMSERGAVLPVAAPLYAGKTGGFALKLEFDASRACKVSGVTEWDASKSKSPFVAAWARDAAVSEAGNIADGCAFRLDDVRKIELAEGLPVIGELLPDGEPVGGGARWSVAKAGKVVFDGATGAVVHGDNPSGLKLSYAAKTGAFKGSFKVHVISANKLKKISATVTGTVVGGVGYGTALVGKKAAYPVRISK